MIPRSEYQPYSAMLDGFNSGYTLEAVEQCTLYRIIGGLVAGPASVAPDPTLDASAEGAKAHSRRQPETTGAAASKRRGQNDNVGCAL
jgi:hypothetical protein